MDLRNLRSYKRITEVWFVLSLLAMGGVARAEDSLQGSGQATEAEIERFEKHIRPALITHCVRCHGPKKQQGGLRLDTRDGWVKGGDSGPAIVPGDQNSLLLSAIQYDNIELEMPPRGKLPEATIQAFRQWIQLGAYDPRTADASSPNESVDVNSGRSFWSFQPVADPAVPEVKDTHWPRTDIDRFILARLEQAGVEPNSDADKETLLRRLYYDLIGLPPTPQQIDRFLSDPSPTAYQDLVDRLLDSHHFGQRWGRHWLDVVRFAQSSGGGRTLLFPDAWRYRDYVIDAFNQDMPFDAFITQQIAGDLIPTDDIDQRTKNLTATAFWLLGPINYEMQDKDILEMDIVDEQLDTLGKALLGMTIGCARCHDHKFDPIPTRDYYALAGIMKSTQVVIHSNVSTWNTVPIPLPREQLKEYQSQVAVIDQVKKQLQDAETKLKRLGGGANDADSKSVALDRIVGTAVDDQDAVVKGDWTSSTAIGGFIGDRYIHDAKELKGRKSVTFKVTLPKPGQYEVLVSYTPGNNRATRVPIEVHYRDGNATVHINQRPTPPIDGAFVSLGDYDFGDLATIVVSNEGTDDGVVIADAVTLISVDQRSADPTVVRKTDVPPDPDRTEQIAKWTKEVERLKKELKRLEKALPNRPVLMATQDRSQAGDIPIAIRGQTHQHGPIVPRGFLQVANWDGCPTVPESESGRRELAQWITDPSNPLTSRVIVNRIWYWLMGRGIVSSVDNFGSMGRPPSHPLLLDHLATEFVRHDWSIKQLVRQIVHSRVYQLSTDAQGNAVKSDPENRLWWRMNRKRLRAEDIRDSLLAVSGQLDCAHGGPNMHPGTKIEYGYQFTSTRRSVYVPVFRNTLPEIFEVFDFADPNQQRGQRNESTVASQALLLMNHPDVIRQSQQSARWLIESGPTSTDARIDYVYRQVLGRFPSVEEKSIAVEFLGPVDENDASGESTAAHDELQAWAALYQVLFQSLDFRYLN